MSGAFSAIDRLNSERAVRSQFTTLRAAELDATATAHGPCYYGASCHFQLEVLRFSGHWALVGLFSLGPVRE